MEKMSSPLGLEAGGIELRGCRVDGDMGRSPIGLDGPLLDLRGVLLDLESGLDVGGTVEPLVREKRERIGQVDVRVFRCMLKERRDLLADGTNLAIYMSLLSRATT